MPRRSYYVYITASKSGVVYTGMCNDLFRRVWQHKARLHEGFTATYNVDRLVYYEAYQYVWDAIEREKQIKGWRRSKKIDLINGTNPAWTDLAAAWYDQIDPLVPPIPRW